MAGVIANWTKPTQNSSSGDWSQDCSNSQFKVWVNLGFLIEHTCSQTCQKFKAIQPVIYLIVAK